MGCQQSAKKEPTQVVQPIPSNSVQAASSLKGASRANVACSSHLAEPAAPSSREERDGLPSTKTNINFIPRAKPNCSTLEAHAGDDADLIAPPSREERAGLPPISGTQCFIPHAAPKCDVANLADGALDGRAQPAIPSAHKVIDEESCNWDAEAQAVVLRAQLLWQEDSVALEAAALLLEALDRFESLAASTEAAAAAMRIRQSQVYEEVIHRVQQFKSILKLLSPNPRFVFMWQKKDTRLWVNAPKDATWFEYKVESFFDVPIHILWCALHEIDLQPNYQPMLVGPPVFLGAHNRHLMVTHGLVSAVIWRIELVMEVMRFVDTKFGYLAEHICSDFPTADIPMPPKSWRNKRIGADTKLFAFPRGGALSGTIVVQATRVDLGVRIPQFMLNWFCDKLSQDYLDNLQKCVQVVKKPDSPWSKRLTADVDGFYKELALVEEASARRESFSLDKLPEPDIFKGPWTSMGSQ